MIVFVLRHADKQPPPEDDLSARGQERAEMLARMLTTSGVSKAYHSGAVRARKTLDPLAHNLGASLDVVELPDLPDIITAVTALSETAVAIVVGHTNTVGPVIEGLCGVSVDPIEDNEFDNLFVLTIKPTGRPILLRIKY